MSVKKAIIMLNWLISDISKMNNNLIDPTKEWNQDDSNLQSLAQSFTSLTERDIEILNLIKKELVRK